MIRTTKLLLALLPLLAVASCQGAGSLDPPMGRPGAVAYAAALWSSMVEARLVGPQAKKLKPFFGGAKPHGMFLEIAFQDLNVRGHRGYLVVKKNYDGPGVSRAAVEADRGRYLSSITVMFKREAGYDTDNQNWFWVKYRPDGTLFAKKMGGREVALAGRIEKGRTPEESRGCIFCHRSAGGGDYIFYTWARPQE